ncbi:MAG: hypothetical protein ABEH58_06685 [Haloplanus sp.]
MSDRSLDEFGAGSAEGDPADDADPSTPTMRWSPDGVACDDCGTVVSRLWADGDAVVCADCKGW